MIVTVAFPVPEAGVTEVSHAGLGFGRVTVQEPAQFIWKVAVPAVAGIETLSGETVTAAAAGALKVTLTDLLPPLIVRVPPAAVEPAVTFTEPLLLPEVGVAVYPLGALTVHATLDVMLMVPDAPAARERVVGLTLRDSVVVPPPPPPLLGPGLSLFSPPQDIASKETIPRDAIRAKMRGCLNNVLI